MFCGVTDHSEVVNGSPLKQPRVLAAQAKIFISRFTEVNRIPALSPSDSVQRWIPPEQGMYKINFDAATFGDTQVLGARAIIRDHTVYVVAAISNKFNGPLEAKVTEAKPAVVAIKLAIYTGFGCVSLECDARNFENALRNI